VSSVGIDIRLSTIPSSIVQDANGVDVTLTDADAAERYVWSASPDRRGAGQVPGNRQPPPELTATGWLESRMGAAGSRIRALASMRTTGAVGDGDAG
jgi:hypothetical protein